MPADGKALTLHLLDCSFNVLQQGALCDDYIESILLLCLEGPWRVDTPLEQDAAIDAASGSVCCSWGRQARQHSHGPMGSTFEELTN